MSKLFSPSDGKHSVPRFANKLIVNAKNKAEVDEGGDDYNVLVMG